MHRAITDSFIANHVDFTGGLNKPSISANRIIIALIGGGIDIMQHHSRQKYIAEFHFKPGGGRFYITHFQPTWIDPDGQPHQIMLGDIMRRD